MHETNTANFLSICAVVTNTLLHRGPHSTVWGFGLRYATCPNSFEFATGFDVL